MGSINSREKGKRAEREAAKLVSQVIGVDAKRGQQHKGGADSADIETDLKDIHFEVKAVEKLNLADAFAQSSRDAGSKMPAVLHKKNRGEWMITFKFEDIWKLFTALEGIKR